jgi:hypothetical protein
MGRIRFSDALPNARADGDTNGGLANRGLRAA